MADGPAAVQQRPSTPVEAAQTPGIDREMRDVLNSPFGRAINQGVGRPGTLDRWQTEGRQAAGSPAFQFAPGAESSSLPATAEAAAARQRDGAAGPERSRTQETAHVSWSELLKNPVDEGSETHNGSLARLRDAIDLRGAGRIGLLQDIERLLEADPASQTSKAYYVDMMRDLVLHAMLQATPADQVPAPQRFNPDILAFAATPQLLTRAQQREIVLYAAHLLPDNPNRDRWIRALSQNYNPAVNTNRALNDREAAIANAAKALGDALSAGVQRPTGAPAPRPAQQADAAQRQPGEAAAAQQPAGPARSPSQQPVLAAAQPAVQASTAATPGATVQRGALSWTDLRRDATGMPQDEQNALLRRVLATAGLPEEVAQSLEKLIAAPASNQKTRIVNHLLDRLLAERLQNTPADQIPAVEGFSPALLQKPVNEMTNAEQRALVQQAAHMSKKGTDISEWAEFLTWQLKEPRAADEREMCPRDRQIRSIQYAARVASLGERIRSEYEPAR